MRINVSKFIDGPSVSDNLSSNISGLDLSSEGLAGGFPGDSSTFTLYVNIRATETEKFLFEAVERVGVYLDRIPTYTGDYQAADDYTDILQMGDMGYGLSMKNPLTGLYEYRFNSTNYNSSDKRFIFKKEQCAAFDKTDVNNQKVVTYFGINNTVASTASTGYNLKTSASVFNSNHKDLVIYNLTDSTQSVIKTVVSPTEVILSTQINDTWDGDTIYIPSLENPIDGLLGITDTATEFGNYYKIDFKFEVPVNYKRPNKKQWALVFYSGK